METGLDRGWRYRWSEMRQRVGRGRLLPLIAVLIVVYLLLMIALGMYWSREPRTLAVVDSDVPGQMTTAALIGVVETLLDKPGGLLSNDIAPPGIWLDNMPAWEYGALVQSRDMARALRESFSRSQSQSREDIDLARAEPRLHFSNNSWALPASEAEYRAALRYLRSYHQRLEDGNDARFYTRADNLGAWLGMAQTRLGSLSLRLSAAVGERRILGPVGAVPAQQVNSAAVERLQKTPWHQIDNVFYESRGSCWAMIQFLRALEREFADVLANKNAQVSLRQIIRELEGTQQGMWSPVILNGDGFGFLANHSLVMASYIARANAGMIDLRDLLSQG